MIIAALLLALTPPTMTLPAEPAPSDWTSPEDRLAQRLDALRTAPSEDAAESIAGEIASLWRQQAGPSADLLLMRADDARTAGDRDTAGRALSHLRLLEPDYPEVWVKSAEHAAAAGDWSFALESLDRAVTLDSDRFDAWALLGRALETASSPEAALRAYEQALLRYPFHPQAREAAGRLRRELDGRAL